MDFFSDLDDAKPVVTNPHSRKTLTTNHSGIRTEQEQDGEVGRSHRCGTPETQKLTIVGHDADTSNSVAQYMI